MCVCVLPYTKNKMCCSVCCSVRIAVCVTVCVAVRVAVRMYCHIREIECVEGVVIWKSTMVLDITVNVTTGENLLFACVCVCV